MSIKLMKKATKKSVSLIVAVTMMLTGVVAAPIYGENDNAQDTPATTENTTVEESVVTASPAEDSAAKNGIVQEDGKAYFYKDNVMQTEQWVSTDGKFYYATEDGSLAMDEFIQVSGKKYYVDSTGAVKTGNFSVDGKYYVGSLSGNPAGAIRTGWFVEGGKGYVATNEGVLYRNRWVRNGKKEYYADNDGSFKTGTFYMRNGYYHGSLSASDPGLVRTGNYYDCGKKYVSDKYGRLTRNRWITTRRGKERYYLDSDGAFVCNRTIAIGGVVYAFRANGTMIVQPGWGSYQGNLYYKGKNGMPVTNQWKTYRGQKYYLMSNGLSARNRWVTIKGAHCYFNNAGVWVKNVKSIPFDYSWRYTGRKVLTKRAGVVKGPAGRETYYNMRMSNVVSRMRRMGFSASAYPYWVRSDGVKMLGPYVIVAANLKTRPRGSVVVTSRGLGLVCDTGGFVRRHPNGIDIAVTW